MKRKTKYISIIVFIILIFISIFMYKFISKRIEEKNNQKALRDQKVMQYEYMKEKNKELFE